MRFFDVVIVGGGAAGCVLASRWSEDAARRVLLLEAGPDRGSDPTQLPEDLADASRLVETNDWGYSSEPGPLGRTFELKPGKLVGGSSATNNVIALRGHPRDYDAWAAAGNPGWSFSEVLPFFRRLEQDIDFGGDWHGTDGPIAIRRPSVLVPLQRAFLEAAAAAGVPRVEDHNAPGEVGVGRLPENADHGVRLSAAVTYLARARGRPNLAVRGNAPVDRVEIEAGRALGVRLATTGEVIRAGRVVLAAGAYGSPAILLRSGIGPPAALAALGIVPRSEVPGVGTNLQEHPLVRLQFRVTAAAEARPPDRPRQTMLTARSERGGEGPDLQVFPSGPIESDDGRALTLYVALLHPASRGALILRGDNPQLAPRIVAGIIEHPDDLARLIAGVRAAGRIAATQPLAGMLSEAEVWAALDRGDEAVAALVRRNVWPYHHAVGTCRMGPADDPLAVVDGYGRVRGVERLQVVDASIMPSIPAANTHLPTLMLAERVAALG